MEVSVTVYCGANPVDKSYINLSTKIGEGIASRGWRLVYGGSTLGMMGSCSNAALRLGGEVVGITLKRFKNYHNGLSEIIFVDTMRERQKLLSDLASAMIILPGGQGTLEEMSEVVVERRYKIHNKPLILVNYKGFWDPLIEQFRRMYSDGFAKDSNFLVIVNSAQDALNRLDQLLHTS